MSKPQGCTPTLNTLLPVISPSPRKSLKTNESISYSLEKERRVSCGVVIQVIGRHVYGCLVRAEPRHRPERPRRVTNGLSGRVQNHSEE